MPRKKTEEKVEIKRPDNGLGKCKHCKKELEAYVVANGERYCSDVCVNEVYGK